MGMFGFLKACLFSEVNGVVLLNGEPVAGAEVTRSATFANETYTDKAVTDEQGRYRFAESSKTSVAKIRYLEPRISQTIVVKVNNREYIAWEAVKPNFDSEGETREPLNLVCELSREPTIKRGKNGNPVNGICVW